MGTNKSPETNGNENDQNVAITTADIGLQTSENDLNSLSVHSSVSPTTPHQHMNLTPTPSGIESEVG